MNILGMYHVFVVCVFTCSSVLYGMEHVEEQLSRTQRDDYLHVQNQARNTWLEASEKLAQKIVNTNVVHYNPETLKQLCFNKIAEHKKLYDAMQQCPKEIDEEFEQSIIRPTMKRLLDFVHVRDLITSCDGENVNANLRSDIAKDLEDLHSIYPIKDPCKKVTCVNKSPCGLILGNSIGEIIIWKNNDNGNSIDLLNGQIQETINFIEVINNKTCLLVAYRQDLKILRLQDHAIIAQFHFDAEVKGVEVSPNGQHAILKLFVDNQNQLWLLDLNTYLLKDLDLRGDELAWLPDNQCILLRYHNERMVNPWFFNVINIDTKAEYEIKESRFGYPYKSYKSKCLIAVSDDAKYAVILGQWFVLNQTNERTLAIVDLIKGIATEIRDNGIHEQVDRIEFEKNSHRALFFSKKLFFKLMDLDQLCQYRPSGIAFSLIRDFYDISFKEFADKDYAKLSSLWLSNALKRAVMMYKMYGKKEYSYVMGDCSLKQID